MLQYLNNISIRNRFLLGITFFVVVLSMSAYKAHQVIDANVQFAAAELKGNAYQRPLAKLLLAAGDLKVMQEAKAKGVAIDSSAIKTLVDQIDAEMKVWEKTDAEIGEDLQFTKEGLESRLRDHLAFPVVAKKWADIASNMTSGAGDADISSFIADIRGAIAHSGDTSNLILDPDLDSYYLMDVTLLVMPQTLDRQVTIANQVLATSAEQGALSQTSAIEIATLARLLKESDMDRLVADMDTVFKEDKNFQGVSPTLLPKISPALEKYNQAHSDLIADLNKIKDGGIVSQADFKQSWSLARNATYDLLTASYDELDAFLNARIDRYRAEQHMAIIISVLGIIGSSAFYLLIATSLMRPMSDLTKIMNALTNNETSCSVPYKESRSEIGIMAQAIDFFKENLIRQKVISDNEKLALEKEIAERDRVEQKTNQFDQRSAKMIQSLQMAADKIRSTADELTVASSETMDAGQTVNIGVSEASASVKIASTAAEKLGISSHEIAQQIAGVANISSRASNEAITTSEKVSELNGLADSIGEVIGAIKAIAEQTNLLALNATIEAARAGEAGKGFAVVADEVKKLASETANKTVEIDERVEKIQNAVRHTVEAVDKIISSVHEIDHAAAAVTTAVEQQNLAMSEIVQNVSVASVRTDQVSGDIGGVMNNAENTTTAALNLNAAASELTVIADDLKSEVSGFIRDVIKK